MPVKILKDPPLNAVVRWKNTTGVTVAAKSLIIMGAVAAVTIADIANNATGAVTLDATIEATATNVDVWTAGTPLGWDSANSKLTLDTSGGALFVAARDKVNGDVTAVVNLAKPATRVATLPRRQVTPAEAAANGVTWDTAFGKAPSYAVLHFYSNVGVPIATATLVNLSGGNLGKVQATTAGGALTGNSSEVQGYAVW